MVSYFFRFYKKKGKCIEDYTKLVIVILWTVLSLFSIFHWPYGDVLSIVFVITISVWLIILILNELKSKNKWLDNYFFKNDLKIT